MAWKALCQLNELHEGKGKYVELGPHQLAVFLSNGQPHVMDNFCPHAGGNLAGGHVQAGCAICPWHDWAFRLDNGQLRDSQYVSVKVYPARILNQPGQPALVMADLPDATP